MRSQKRTRAIKSILLRIGISLTVALIVVVMTHELRFQIPGDNKARSLDFRLGILEDIDFLTIDYRFQQRSQRRDLRTTGDVVIVKISDEDIVALPGTYPFPRSYYGHVVENLNRAGAKVIALDITFSTPTAEDSSFRSVLEKNKNVILGIKAASETYSPNYDIHSREPKYDNVFYDVNKRLGVVNVLKDRDGVVRRYLPAITVDDFLTPTFAIATLNSYWDFSPDTRPAIESDAFVYHDMRIPKYDPITFMLNYYGPVGSFKYVPFSHVIDDERFSTQDELDTGEEFNTFDENMMSIFKDKIVFIGSTMAEERDFHNVPLPNPVDGGYLMHGVEIHATAVQNIVDGAFLSRAKESHEILFVFITAIVSFFLIGWFKKIRFRYVVFLELAAFLIVLFGIFGIFEFSVLRFSQAGILMSVVNPSLAIVLAYVGTIVHQYLSERQQKTLIKAVFSHYINPSVVNELVANPEKATLGGDRRELTVFFTDIAGFTSISERLSPEEIVDFLNDYLEEMTKIIFDYEGTLDKYEGDAIMAFWGAPMRQADHALRACNAALEMQKRLDILRPKWKKEGKPLVHVRCGINTGMMIVGNLGGRERFDYTVIGDSVNLASRLEGANKQYKSKIMISEFTHKHVTSLLRVRELDLIQVVGKQEPVRVYELLGANDMHLSENMKQATELYDEGLRLYRNRKFEEAAAYMELAYKLDPTCHAAQIYVERANLYQIAPPPPDWNGVFVMASK